MKRGSTLLLKFVVILIGLSVLALLIVWGPRVIGEIQWGGYDPILLGLYVTAIPFFIALYQAWMLLNYIDKGTAFSALSVKALKNIKYCGIAISVMYLVEMPYIFYVAELDDAPGAVLIGLVIIFASGVIATFAGLLQKLLKEALAIKAENDLTV